MAFPSIRSSAITNGTTATASPVVNLPATIAAGDTLIVYFKNAAAGAIGFPAGWVELVDASPDASVGQIGIAYKKAIGGEGGTTITLSSGNGKFAAVARAIAGATDPTIRAPEISTVAVGTTGEPNATVVTPTGGAKDYLWDTVYLMEGEQTGITANPANYSTSQQFANSGTAGAVTTNCTIGAVARTNNAASEDAGVWDVAGTLDDSSAYTLAFHPAEAIAQPLAPDGDFPFPLPAPRLSAPLVALTIASSLLQSTLAPLEPQPTPPVVWGNPAPRAVLVTTTSAYPADDAAIAFAQRDWPNPAPRRPAALSWLQNLQQSTLAPAAEAQPFRQDVWDLPRRSSSLGHPSASPNLLGSTLGPPVPPLEWPLPLRRPATPSTWTQNLLESTLTPAEPTPVVPLEWPLPRRAVASALTWTQERPTYYEDARILRQDDWPLPTRRPAREVLSSTQNLLETTLAPAPATKPFAQNDWPLPLRPSLPRLTWTQERQAYYVDQAPTRGLDPWVVPPRPTWRDRSGSTNLLESTLAPATPIAPLVWPNPATRPRPLEALAGSSRALLAAEPPIRPLEWTIPPSRAYPIALRTWTQERKPHAVDLQPFAQHDWPIPAGRPVVFDLRVWFRAALTDAGFTVLLLGIIEEQLRAAAAADEALRLSDATGEALRGAGASNDTLEPF